jgi:hypothetical protein
MSSTADLPPSAFRLFKLSTEVSLEGIATPGQKATGRETWRVLATKRNQAFAAIGGKPEVVGGYGGALIRLVPLRHPEYPNVLFASSATARGIGFDAAAHFWKFYDFTVNFESRPYATSGQDAFLSRSGQPSSRSFPGPAAGFRLNGSPPPFDPGEEIDGEEVSWTSHNLPTLSTNVYDAVRNCVNNDIFYNRPAGTMRYNGPSYSQTSTISGDPMWEVTHTFTYSKIPWNSYYASDGNLYELFRADGTTPRYIEADLTSVFSV